MQNFTVSNADDDGKSDIIRCSEEIKSVAIQVSLNISDSDLVAKIVPKLNANDISIALSKSGLLNDPKAMVI
jgi:hypothetical protein